MKLIMESMNMVMVLSLFVMEGCGSNSGNNNSCDGSGPVLVFHYPEQNINFEVNDFTIEKGGGGGLSGMKGTYDNGTMEFWLGRDGDNGDGSFSEVKTYDMGIYPYHLVLAINPVGVSESQCATNSDCKIFFGLKGLWNITKTDNEQSHFQGTFTSSGGITSEENCWTDSNTGVDTSGCTNMLEGTISGCFSF